MLPTYPISRYLCTFSKLIGWNCAWFTTQLSIWRNSTKNCTYNEDQCAMLVISGNVHTQDIGPLLTIPFVHKNHEHRSVAKCLETELQTTYFCLLLFYVLATANIISVSVPTCDRVHSWRHYSASPLGNQAVSNMTWPPTQSHYLDTEPTSPCPILVMPSIWLGSDKYQLCKSLLWILLESNSPSSVHLLWLTR